MNGLTNSCNPITHIIMFKLKESSEENIQLVGKNLTKLNAIELIKAMQIVVNKDKTEYAYDLAMIMQFDSKEDTEKYLIHPIHKNDVVIKVTPYIEKTAVIDLNAKDIPSNDGFAVNRNIILFSLMEPVQEKMKMLSRQLEELRKLPFVTKLVALPNIVESTRNYDMVLVIDLENRDRMTQFLKQSLGLDSILMKTEGFIQKFASVSYVFTD